MNTQHTPIAYGGLALVRELREEANEIALDRRADLVRRGADEIARLIEETKTAPSLLSENARLRGYLNDAASMLDHLTGENLEAYSRTFAALARAALQGGGL